MLSTKLRVIIGLFSIPSLMLLAMLIYAVIKGDQQSIGVFEVIYSIVGVIAMFMALTGKRLF
ncbi:MAG: hypothetical protein AAGJ37_03240 [Pseudomonadota bacterium]